jgi:hypothetical protein
MPMDDLTRVAVLIDADNVNVELVSEVLRRLDDGSRRLQHRRAYGSLQKAAEFAVLSREHALRFLTTTYAGTNGTDVALAIDAIELAINEPVDEFVLVTSDCDFLPLAARLRELGCRVCGFGQEGKSARNVNADYLRVYDEFTVITASAGKPRVASRRTPRPRSAALSAREADLPPANISMLHPPADEEIRRILEAVPALLDGKKVELSTAATQLRAANLLARNAPSPKLFKKYPDQFELTPARQPNKVQYRAR